MNSSQTIRPKGQFWLTRDGGREASFLLDVRKQELRNAEGGLLDLEANAAKVLCFLVNEGRNKLVRLEDLYRLLGITDKRQFFELRTAITAIRKALRDSKQPYVFIRNRTAKGYVFVGKIVPIDGHKRITNFPLPLPEAQFRGREKELSNLRKVFADDDHRDVPRLVVLSGPAGVGKTRLATEFGWKLGYTTLLLVFSNNLQDLNSGLAALCKILKLSESASANQELQVEAVLEWLKAHSHWLLILDNVDTYEVADAVRMLVREIGVGHVLVTTRITDRWAGVELMSLKVVSLQDAVNLLVAANPDESLGTSADAEALAETLGRLPYALRHAASYLRRDPSGGYLRYREMFLNDESVEELLRFHDEAIEVDFKANPEEKMIERTLATTFSLSFRCLGPTAKAILQSLSLLAPRPVPVEMLEICAKEVLLLVRLWCRQSGEKTSVVNKDSIKEGLAELTSFSLVDRRQSTIEISPVEQRVLRARIKNSQLPRWVELTRALIIKYLPDETSESPRTWGKWELLRPHAEAIIAQTIKDHRIAPDQTLSSAMSSFYFGRSLYNLSLQMEEETLKAVQRANPERSTPVADALLALGESQRVLEKHAEAVDSFERSLAIREVIDGADHLRVADVLNYLGLALHGQEKLTRAEECYRRALTIYRSHGNSASRADKAKVLGNLGTLLSRPDSIDEARSLFEEAVLLTADRTDEAIKPQLGVISRAKLANLLRAKGEVDRAGELFRDAVDRASGFPPDHPIQEVLIDVFARFLRDNHKLSAAIEVYSRLQTAERAPWGSPAPERRPERSIRQKLRICETTLTFKWQEQIDDEHPTVDELVLEALSSQWKPWQPPIIKGMTVVDSRNLRFNWVLDPGTSPETINKDTVVRMLTNVFLESVATNEDSHWANSDGSMATELRGTSVGEALVGESRHLRSFVFEAIAFGVSGDRAFMNQMIERTSALPKNWPAVTLEVWVAPSKMTVYKGPFVDSLAAFAVPGEENAFVIDYFFDIYWECRLAPRATDGPNINAFAEHFNSVFAEVIAPLVRRLLHEGRLFAGLRQLSYSMTLATFFKTNYKRIASVAKYFETENPKQLNISYVSTEPRDKGDSSTGTGVIVSTVQNWFSIRNRAFELYELGSFDQALALLETLLQEDFEIPSTRCHVARILLLTGHEQRAREEIAFASNDLAEAPVYIRLRVLFFNTMFAILDTAKPVSFLAQIKVLLGAETANKWSIEKVLDHLHGPRLSDPDYTFLSALATALNDPHELWKLEGFAMWREIPPA